MTIYKQKNNFPHVKIFWSDIQSSNEAWIEEQDILKEDTAYCCDTGFIFKKNSEKLWLFTSYSYDKKKNLSIGGLTVFPIGCIKKIERIK